MSKTRKDKAVQLAAVIDIGASAIRLVIAEVDPDGEWRRLDRASRPVFLGRDVFMTGFISRESLLQAVRILRGYREMLDGWRIGPDSVRVIATSAIREAKNRDIFLDRVMIQTGLEINVVEGVEENHLTYLAVQHAVGSMRPQFARSSSLIIEVGGGTTELMLLRRGKMVAAHSLRIGTVRLEQQVNPSWESASRIEEYLRESIRVTQEILNAELELDKIRYFVAVGGDARLAANTVGRQEEEHFRVIDRADFDAFMKRLQRLTVDEIVQELSVTYNEAEGLVAALLVYKVFLDSTSAEQLIVPDVSIREGVLLSFALEGSQLVEEQFYNQVVASTRSIGKKFHYDEDHAEHVTVLALSLFDQLQDEHGLGPKERVLFEVACRLHDIGTFLRASGHHKHGQYIIQNSEIFGLSNEDLRLVSNIVRYHRKSSPLPSHGAYMSLRREQRMAVLKLAAILRIADALDRGHMQRVSGVRVEVRDDEVIIHCEYSGDISVERYGMELKGRMFQEVFGYRVLIA